jgi:hypothetical protein
VVTRGFGQCPLTIVDLPEKILRHNYVMLLLRHTHTYTP